MPANHVALGGSVLSTFVQLEPFVTAYHVAVLLPREPMALPEKLWWACCIEANHYRYNYGRQANRTLADLMLPGAAPDWVASTPHEGVEELRASIRGIADPTVPEVTDDLARKRPSRDFSQRAFDVVHAATARFDEDATDDE